MAQAQNKTTENNNSVGDFLDTVTDAGKRADSLKIIELFSEWTGFGPKMWGSAIIGFGTVHYKYASGREGDMPLSGFSPRKNNITIYMSDGFEGREALLSKLGKHTSSKACIYIRKLEDIDMEILKKINDASIAHTKKLYP